MCEYERHYTTPPEKKALEVTEPRQQNDPTNTLACGAVTPGTRCREQRTRLWVMCCFIEVTLKYRVVRCFAEATLEHSQAPGPYVQACACSRLPPHYLEEVWGPHGIAHATTRGKTY